MTSSVAMPRYTCPPGERPRPDQAGPRELEHFRCFYVSAPFVVPKSSSRTAAVTIDCHRPRPLTWEHQPLTTAEQQALSAGETPDGPDEFLYHPDGFKRKKLLDVIRESLASHPARHRTPSGFRRWRSAQPRMHWSNSGGANHGGSITVRPRPGFPVGMEDFPEEHAQRCTSSTRRWTT